MSLKKYIGGAWNDTQALKRNSGGAWAECEAAKRWNGSAWVPVWENYPVKLETDNSNWTMIGPMSYVKSTKDQIQVVGTVGYSRYGDDRLEYGVLIPVGIEFPILVSRFDCDYHFYGETKGMTEDDGSVLQTLYTGDRMRFGVYYKQNGYYHTSYLCIGNRYSSEKAGQGYIQFGGSPWLLEEFKIVVEVYGSKYPYMKGTAVQGYFSNLRFNGGKKWRFPDFEKSGS